MQEVSVFVPAFRLSDVTLWRTPPERRLLAFRRRLQPRFCVWRCLRHCLVYFQYIGLMTFLTFFQGNRFSQRRFRMGHFSKKGILIQLFLGSDSASSEVAGWATS